MEFEGNAASDPSAAFEADPCFLKCTRVQTTDKFNNPLKTKENGYAQWVLELTSTEGDSANRKVFHRLVFIPPGKPGHGMALHTLHAFGLKHEGKIDVQPYDFEGVTAKAKVIIKPANNGYPPKAEVGKWYLPDERAPEAGTPTQQQAVDKLAQAGIGAAPAADKKPLWGGK